MKNKNSIVFFDLETTGLSQTKDRIIEMYMLKKNPDGTEEEWYSRFNPGAVRVSDEAKEVHGISNEDLQNEPTFENKVSEILDFIKGCDLGGYNLARFDIPMLFEECYRAGSIYNFKKHRVIDVYSIWSTYEPRTLTGAVKRYLGENHEYAHEATADVKATAKVFEKQLQIYASQIDTIDEMISSTTANPNAIDFSGKFEQSEDKIIITFGKHKGKTIEDVYLSDEGYLRWMYEKAEFPTDTKLIARSLYGKMADKFTS